MVNNLCEFADGQLRHSRVVKAVVLIGGIFAVSLIYVLLSENYDVEDSGQTEALMWMILGFGSSAVALGLESFGSRGTFDQQAIYFETFWTGKKQQSWETLVSIDYSIVTGCYGLSFQDGTVIRISYSVKGIKQLMMLLEKQGFKL